MKQGWRKLILGCSGIISITLTAVVTKDATITLACGGMITSLLATVMYGYNAEYKEGKK